MSSVFAAPTAVTPVAGPGFGSLLQVSVSLFVVIALVFAFGWLARRLRTTHRGSGPRLEVLAEAGLGTRERAVLLQVGRTRLLVGVAAGSVRTLHVLGDADDVPAGPAVEGGTAATPGFKDLLMKGLGR
jgi:flagellar protein FliO/FliZ